MNRLEAIEQACNIVALAYRSVGDYTLASDGFCERCLEGMEPRHYQNEGAALDYVRNAVVKALRADGYKIPNGWDASGKEIRP